MSFKVAQGLYNEPLPSNFGTQNIKLRSVKDVAVFLGHPVELRIHVPAILLPKTFQKENSLKLLLKLAD